MPPGATPVSYTHLGKFVVVTPTGEVRRKMASRKGEEFFRLIPSDEKIWYGVRSGQDPKEGVQSPITSEMVLRVRGVNSQDDGTDSGIRVTRPCFLSGDGKTVGKVVIIRNGNADHSFVFKNTLVEVATKREKKLDLPENHQLLNLAPDGTWALTLEYVFPPEKMAPAYRFHHFPIGGGKPRVLTGTIVTWGGGSIDPEGKRVFVFGEDVGGKKELSLQASAYVVDVEAATATRIAGNEMQHWSSGVWSPDGKRIAYAWRALGQDRNSNGVPPTRLVVCDADGKNASTVLTTDDFCYPVAWR